MLQIDTYQEKYTIEFMSQLLKNRAGDVCEVIAQKYDVELWENSLYEYLESKYTDADRHYHGLRHIITMLDLYDRISQNIESEDNRVAMQYAILFHDCIYDAKKGDSYNIPESISWAKVPLLDYKVKDFRLLVETYILATNHYYLFTNQNIRNAMSLEEKIISDIDLAGFAFGKEQFDTNNNNIRLEFSHLTDDEFNEGQIKFMKLILSLDKIYLTEFFSEYEGTARKNIEGLIKMLSGNNQS